MKLTTRSEYALLALMHLSRQPASSYTTVDSIATAQGIPPQFLEQILLSLKRAQYLKSVKGRTGGYALAKSPDRITIAEIVRHIDGALAPTVSVSTYFYEPTPIEKEQKLLRLFKEIRDVIADRLEHTTLADVI
jgi:Rrf2 family protein